MCQENTMVRVIGSLREYEGKRHVLAYDLSAIMVSVFDLLCLINALGTRLNQEDLVYLIHFRSTTRSRTTFWRRSTYTYATRRALQSLELWPGVYR